jgi:peptide-methionine (R)-S-oxide reductase
MNRRTWLGGVVAAIGFHSLVGRAAAPKTATMADVEAMRKNWRTFLPAGAVFPASTDRLELPDTEWRKRLSRAAYDVLRREDTEPPGSSPLNNEQRPGVFVCAGCDLPLFTSAMKFDSGTGWPSFFTTIPGAFNTKPDRKLFITRTEYHCRRCGGHHGHVFDDGPEPTKERWCNNGAALKFVAKT